MEIIDVSNWKKDDETHAPGTRKKYWLIKPGSEKRYLFKFPKENTGEAWAEVIAARIGDLLELNVHHVIFAQLDDKYGVLSENFCDVGEEFHSGGDLFYSICPDFELQSLENQLELLFQVLTKYGYLAEFICVLIFDALIANQDRHCDNWGIIRAADNSVRLAPIYDNGSSLGYGLSEEKVSKMLLNRDMFYAYTRRSQTMFGLSGRHRPKTLEVFSILQERYPQELKYAIEKLELISAPMIQQIVETVPEVIMSDIYRDWVDELVLYRKEWLLNWYYKEKE